MNKKLCKPVIVLFALSLIISGCKKDEPHFFELDKTTLSFEIEGGSQNIAISSNETWTISNNADWITVSPQSGNGNATVTITASENETFDVRKTTLTFSSGTKTVTVEITQRETLFLELDKTALTFEAEGGTQNISISSNGNWTVSSDVDWIAVSHQSGNGNATVVVTASENQAPIAREATLTFTVGTQVVVVEIAQEANAYQGVVISGIRWATRNVDMPGTFAENPESLGMFYQWGRNIGWSSTNPIINSSGSSIWNTSHPTGTEWEKANDPCPTGWRVPTREEVQTLGDTDNVTSQWTNANGINGRTFTYIDTGNAIFLPAVGFRRSDGLLSSVTSGFYWSSTFDGISVWNLWFHNVNIGSSNMNFKREGLSIRCVAE